MVPYKFWNYLFNFCEKRLWYLDGYELVTHVLVSLTALVMELEGGKLNKFSNIVIFGYLRFLIRLLNLE